MSLCGLEQRLNLSSVLVLIRAIEPHFLVQIHSILMYFLFFLYYHLKKPQKIAKIVKSSC